MSVQPTQASALAPAVALIAALLVPAAVAAEPVAIRARPVALDTEDAKRTRVGELEFLAGFALSADHPYFGGLSGLTIGPDGRALTAVSDRGWWLTGRLELAADGRLAGIEAAQLQPIRRADGRPVRIENGEHDAEAVERLADGGFVVSFERRHRLWRFASPASPAMPYVSFPGLQRQPVNGGIEALAVLGDGRLLLVSEASRDEQGGHRGWLWHDGRADALSYVAADGFKPTDLALLANGDVLVLERYFSPIGGTTSRLAIVPRKALAPASRLQGREIARLEWPLIAENFEGLAVVSPPGGDSLVYLISDDNFNPLQDTLLLQFRLAR